ncbi:MAG: ABC transporter ATP-binding protein [Acidimicrobiaceae bacterium]|nr:ABC transporter ATP-binding protein [Acidimicrobiaceae bacterium]MXW75767.1 ABC transporter ATP-binding protein [Acidimicrobiaceae bacterium]MYA75004.1 ABC transporter ATP-binding protein [Acidimicrobiaceae bacterium]MYD05753.1 ABC transporter ATP-binding protein [Acidimicrobiaceae bacterium]MYG55408.1 ABC transporter ATP-binding protein [Acidimicrobiaceae bacterium]
MTLAIELTGITKRFPGVVANDNVNLSVETGEIHAVCGENGAGKSTLMKILFGMQSPDEGTMRIHGEEVRFSSPAEAIDRGIGMVHQHFMLAAQLTVLENVILGAEPVAGLGRIDFKAAEAHLREVGEAYGLDVDPHDLIESLEVGERQRVEIIKVLYRGARILILDEPTAVLVPHEVDELFRNMAELKAAGETILFIDHKLDEVLRIADTITVLRQGRTVATVKPDEVSTGDLAEMMVGSELPTPQTSRSTVTDELALSIKDLTVLDADGRAVLDSVSLDVHRGEVVGLAGVEGNGQNEFVGAIIGTEEVQAGSIRLLGEEIAHSTVRHRRNCGIGYVPQDRQQEGLLLFAPLWENAALGHQSKPPFANGRWFDRFGARERTEAIRGWFDVRTPDIEVTANSLSGGNQQKLIVGREMAAEPRVLIAAHPTRGIDVGAQAAVWDDIRAARAEGMGTLLISADLDELIGLSDTIVVIHKGQLTATLDPASVTPRQLGSYMTGSEDSDAELADGSAFEDADQDPGELQ